MCHLAHWFITLSRWYVLSASLDFQPWIYFLRPGISPHVPFGSLVYYALQVVRSVCFPGLPTLDLLPKTRNLPTCAIWLTFLCTSLKTAAFQENHPLSPPGTILWDFPGGASVKEPACQCKICKRHGFDPWVRKIPWRRKWQPTPIFLPGESHGPRKLAGHSP